MVIRMREQGLKATGCNAAIRAINAYLHWSGSPHKIQPLKEPKQVMPTFTAEQVLLLIDYKPTTDFQRRLHLLIMILLDTGCRISEALSIRSEDIDLDNLLITLHGKGRKDRRVFTIRLFVLDFCATNEGDFNLNNISVASEDSSDRGKLVISVGCGQPLGRLHESRPGSNVFLIRIPLTGC